MLLKKIGIAGCGVIGSRLARTIKKDFFRYSRLSALYDLQNQKAESLAGSLGKKDKDIAVASLDELIRRSDLVIEASSADACPEILRKAINQGRDCIVMSVGGLLNHPGLIALAGEKRVSLYIPSGAICGIDGLKAHKLSGLKKVVLTTTKPVLALKDAPYVRENKINLENIREEKEIFKGRAQEAVKAFPQNINVAAVLSLAGMGKDKTIVRIIASPKTGVNTHEIEVESKAGRSFIRCQNVPCPDNPKTSYLAVLSAVSTLKQIFDSVKIGT